MTMQSEEALDRILRALTTELRATHNIGSIEARVGRSRGYFSKVSARKWRISLDVLLRTLEVLEIDPETFFANAFAQRPPSERVMPQRGYPSPSRFPPLGNVTDLARHQPPASGRRW